MLLLSREASATPWMIEHLVAVYTLIRSLLAEPLNRERRSVCAWCTELRHEHGGDHGHVHGAVDPSVVTSERPPCRRWRRGSGARRASPGSAVVEVLGIDLPGAVFRGEHPGGNARDGGAAL
jgi:hypothetical protein